MEQRGFSIITYHKDDYEVDSAIGLKKLEDLTPEEYLPRLLYNLNRIKRLCRRGIDTRDLSWFREATREKIRTLKQLEVSLEIFGEGIHKNDFFSKMAWVEDLLNDIELGKWQLEEEQKHTIVEQGLYVDLWYRIRALIDQDSEAMKALSEQDKELRDAVAMLHLVSESDSNIECTVQDYRFIERLYFQLNHAVFKWKFRPSLGQG